MKLNFIRQSFSVAVAVLLFASCCKKSPEPVDYVNPYMGNMSHMLVPTFPMTHLPNSMMRMRPDRDSYISDYLHGLPMMMASHRGTSVFRISPAQEGEYLNPVQQFTWDNEVVKPYSYEVRLDESATEVSFAPSHQSAIYEFNFEKQGENLLIFHTENGSLSFDGNTLQGFQDIDKETFVYVYLETDVAPSKVGGLDQGKAVWSGDMKGEAQTLVLAFPKESATVKARYGVSFISVEQAKKNLQREISGYDLEQLAQKGRNIWNETLGKIDVNGATEDQKSVFYTSLYRTYERMICISEDGQYFSGTDKKVHSDEGTPFFTDDWIWDTYRATHPLRIIVETKMENAMIQSYVRMAQQSKEGWLPTFPEVNGDSHRMNGNHGVAVIADAMAKGLTGFDLEAAYGAAKSAIEEETHAPWSRHLAGEYDRHYKEHGYFPGLNAGQEEYLPEVDRHERRQSVAVTQAAAYDEWCLSLIAEKLGKSEDAAKYLKGSFNYRNLFNPETKFFHPKNSDGQFIQPFDYKLSGGMGARDYYDENNGWTYRWDVPHNVVDLIDLMGGNQEFITNLDQLFNEDLGLIKWDFWALLPDQTGNVGQFSMGNEPSLHIPYLYNYAGAPWKTQLRIRRLMDQWFRNDTMGVPGDEDGGGMSAFVVFSSMGFYPVTPGSDIYSIGSPIFSESKISLENGKTFVVKADKASSQNKYIQSATINGRQLNEPFFKHSDIANGGVLVLEMGDKPNKSWGAKR